MSQGDPQGVGPDLILQAAAQGYFEEADQIVACPQLLQRRAAEIGTDWANLGLSRLRDLVHPGAMQGVSQFSALQEAVTRVLDAKTPTALVTAPIDKAVAAAEGLPTPGHTEYLALRTKAPEVAMLMAGPLLRVTLATVHIALKEVSANLDAQVIKRRTALLVDALRVVYGKARPRIALLGLNPHAGEQGRFGTEEVEMLDDLVQSLARTFHEQAQIVGPLPADTAFYQHAQGELDGLVAMYHDQGLAPFKLLHFHNGVNVTLGLPFFRSSPDHGTAKDKAGTTAVDARSFLSAVTLARGRRDEIDAWMRQGAVWNT